MSCSTMQNCLNLCTEDFNQICFQLNLLPCQILLLYGIQERVSDTFMKKSNCHFHTLKIRLFSEAWPRYSKILSVRVSKYWNKQRFGWLEKQIAKQAFWAQPHFSGYWLQLNRLWCVIELIYSLRHSDVSSVVQILPFGHFPTEWASTRNVQCSALLVFFFPLSLLNG